MQQVTGKIKSSLRIIVGTYEIDKTYDSIMTENIKHTVIQAVSMYFAKRIRYG